MWRLLFLLSAVIIAAAIFARGWYGRRVIASVGTRPSRLNVGAWSEAMGEGGLVPESSATVEEHGRALRLAALELWKKRDPNAAKARDASLRFGLAVPPLSVAVVVFAVIVAKILPFSGLAIIVLATALATLMGLLSLGAELRAVAVGVRLVRERHVFPRREDEDAVAQCAKAEVWLRTLPPILKWIS
jgi:hypothetical protein